MLTRMTDGDWVIALDLFRASGESVALQPETPEPNAAAAGYRYVPCFIRTAGRVSMRRRAREPGSPVGPFPPAP